MLLNATLKNIKLKPRKTLKEQNKFTADTDEDKAKQIAQE